jgi:hypothetical protein
MARMKRHLISLIALLAAIVCYFVGWGEGIIPIVVLGVCFELFFWVRVLRRPKRPAGASGNSV